MLAHLVLRYIEYLSATIYVPVDFPFRPWKDYRVNVWDTSGDLKFLDVRNEFYKEAQGVILVPWS